MSESARFELFPPKSTKATVAVSITPKAPYDHVVKLIAIVVVGKEGAAGEMRRERERRALFLF